MIVVDTNVIAYLTLAGTHTMKARKAFHRDPDWAAPNLSRPSSSDFRFKATQGISGQVHFPRRLCRRFIRVISARDTNRKERKAYQSHD